MAKALSLSRAMAGRAFIKLACAAVGATHTTTISLVSTMKTPSWLKKTKNNGEAGSSSSARRCRSTSSLAPSLLLCDLPPAPKPKDYRVIVARTRLDRLCVPLDECEQRWRDGEDIDHYDVSLPAGWHLNHARVSIP
jgi:hypothetical protein